MRLLEQFLIPGIRGGEVGGFPIPYSLAVYSGSTLRPPQPKEKLQQGVNGLRFGQTDYQITEVKGKGGMGVTYAGHAVGEVHSLPERIIVKEMTFDVPEAFISSRQTVEAYIHAWENSLPRRNASTLRQSILDTISKKEYQDALRARLDKYPQTVAGITSALSDFATSQDQEDLRVGLEKQKQQYLREAAILKLLEQKGVRYVPKMVGNVLKIHETQPGLKHLANLYIAQTEIPGLGLDKVLANQGAFTEVAGCKVTLQLLSILEDVQKAGIVHRDIKPENVLFDIKNGSMRVGLVDFGIAVPFDPAVVRLFQQNHITTHIEAQGTSGYFAPEALVDIVDPSADTYAAGRLLFSLLTGQALMEENANAFKRNQLAPNRDIPDRLTDLIRLATIPEYKERLSVSEFRLQLEMHIEAKTKAARHKRLHL